MFHSVRSNRYRPSPDASQSVPVVVFVNRSDAASLEAGEGHPGRGV